MQNPRKVLHNLYRAAVGASQSGIMREAPETVQRSRVNLSVFEGFAFKWRLLSCFPGSLILVLGDFYGIDYFPFRAAGCHAVVLDIAPQHGIPHFILADATAAFPFRDASFDVVIAGEILEHLVDDVVCLREIRRVLKEEGKLLLTVPFHNDVHRLHIRVHSPRSIRSLCEATGFRVVKLVERGGLINLERFPPYVLLKHAINAFAFMILRRTFYDQWNGTLTQVDWWLGTRVPFLLRHTTYWGGYVLAVRDKATNFARLNRDLFSDPAESTCTAPVAFTASVEPSANRPARTADRGS